MKLGELISLARECKGISSRELARITGISHSQICHIETGYVKEPGWWKVVSIASVLGLKLDRLAAAARDKRKEEALDD